MRHPALHAPHTTPVHRAVPLVLTLLLVGCGGAAISAPLGAGAAAPVAATGLDPRVLLDSLPEDMTPGWQRADGGTAVEVTLDEVRLADASRAEQYAEAGFEAGARLSLARDDDRLAIMVDRFPHPAAAHQVEDWHVGETGMTLVDGVSQVGTTAEGVLVVEDLVVRVVAVGAGDPDVELVRSLLEAVREAALPRP